jgi:CRP/FNR family cyclic AMP-dependent transcriptional regulator
MHIICGCSDTAACISIRVRVIPEIVTVTGVDQLTLPSNCSYGFYRNLDVPDCSILNTLSVFLHLFGPNATVADSNGVPLIYFLEENLRVIPRSRHKTAFDVKGFLNKADGGRTIVSYRNSTSIFVQGDPADAIFYIQKGKVKLTVVSKRGKEAVVALLGEGDFFGEGCLAGQPLRMATAVALSTCSIMKLDKPGVVRLLHEEPLFSEMFVAHLLSRNIKIEEDLVDQLFNSSEKRLARVLLLLANFGKEGKPQEVIPKMSQETLAEIVGTTRSRVSFFMNRFRKLGFIEYNGTLRIHSSLLNIILHD